MALLARLAETCRSLPGATESVKWGNDLVFCVGTKMFCVFGYDNQTLKGVSFKVPDERFLEYTDRDGFIPAPYLARARWVSLVDEHAAPVEELVEAVRTSYQLVRSKLPKKVQAELL